MPEINIILIYRKLGSVGPIQQKIKLPLPYADIHRHLMSKCFKNAVIGCQEMVHCKYFSDTKQIMFAEKFVKSESFWLCCGAFSVSSEMRLVK